MLGSFELKLWQQQNLVLSLPHHSEPSRVLPFTESALLMESEQEARRLAWEKTSVASWSLFLKYR